MKKNSGKAGYQPIEIFHKINLFGLFIILAFLFTRIADAQELAFRPGINNYQVADTTYPSDTSKAGNLNDLSNLSLAFKSKLLPDRMSFMEKWLWGENGFMRKIGIAGPLNADTRKDELQARRTMLSIHQITGLATLGLMMTTAYYGQKVIDGRWDLSGTHKFLAGSTITAYAVTGLLAILSPPPIIRRGHEESTISVHKLLAWVHFAGMILTPIIGSMVVKHNFLNMNKARFHQVAAYITTATFAASVIVLTF